MFKSIIVALAGACILGTSNAGGDVSGCIAPTPPATPQTIATTTHVTPKPIQSSCGCPKVVVVVIDKVHINVHNVVQIHNNIHVNIHSNTHKK